MRCPRCRRHFDEEARICAYDGTLLVAEGDRAAPLGERLEPGTVVGDFRVERLLGEGGMGQVYAAVQPLIEKRVAIKVLKSRERELCERFIQEARAVNRIRHRHIVDIYTFGQLSDGRYYSVMELLEGVDLEEHLRGGPLPLAEAVSILRQVASPLAAAHANGIVHRDLKPANIFLCREHTGLPGEVKLLDFGIARLMAPEGDTAAATWLATRPGTLLGTPAYMPPECFNGPVSDLRAVDRYALGVVAWQLLTGTLPFQGGSLLALVTNILLSPLPPASSLNSSLPKEVDAILARALARQPDQRYPAVEGLVEALEGVARGAQAGSSPVLGPISRGGGALPHRGLEGPSTLAAETPVPGTLPVRGGPQTEGLDQATVFSFRAETSPDLKTPPGLELLSGMQAPPDLETPPGLELLKGLETPPDVERPSGLEKQALGVRAPVAEASSERDGLGLPRRSGLKDPQTLQPPRAVSSRRLLWPAGLALGGALLAWGVWAMLPGDTLLPGALQGQASSVGRPGVTLEHPEGKMESAGGPGVIAGAGAGPSAASASGLEAGPARNPAPPVAPEGSGPAASAGTVAVLAPSSTAGDGPNAGLALKVPTSSPVSASAVASASDPGAASRQPAAGLQTVARSVPAAGQPPASSPTPTPAGPGSQLPPGSLSRLGALSLGKPMPRVAGLTLDQATPLSLEQVLARSGRKGAVVELFSAGCSACGTDLKALAGGKGRLTREGVGILLVGVDEETERLEAEVARWGVASLPLIQDATGAVVQRLGLSRGEGLAPRLPVSVVVDGRGRVLALFNKASGGHVERILEAIRQGS